MNASGFEDGPQLPEMFKPIVAQWKKYNRMYHYQLDRTAPHTMERWLATVALNGIFMLRIVFSQGVSELGTLLHVCADILGDTVVHWFVPQLESAYQILTLFHASNEQYAVRVIPLVTSSS